MLENTVTRLIDVGWSTRLAKTCEVHDSGSSEECFRIHAKTGGVDSDSKLCVRLQAPLTVY